MLLQNNTNLNFIMYGAYCEFIICAAIKRKNILHNSNNRSFLLTQANDNACPHANKMPIGNYIVVSFFDNAITR